jgi:hypothetical protein
MADRYCRNCGQELAENGHFCSNCGSPVYEAARVPTPEADVPVPPPPQQAGTSASRRMVTMSRLFVGTIFVLLGLFGLFVITSITEDGGDDQQSASSGATDNSKRDIKRFMAGKSTSPNDIRKCAVGQPCKMGDSTLTVTAVSRNDIVPITYDKPLTEGPYVFVDYRYTYGGNEVVSISDYPQFPLQAGERVYMLDYNATSSWSIEKDEDITMEDMQPGVPITGHIVYKVASGSKDFILGVEDLIAPNKSEPAAIPVL